MDSLIEEFGHPTFTSFPVIVARLFLAALFGAAIGFEREWRNRSAGLRTHILICVATATFAILTIEIVHLPTFALDGIKESVKVDPIRVVEAVTAGIAFLSAGTIMFSRGEVQGLTTGAGMWLAGAIGLAAGLGLWQIATFSTVLVLVVLGVMHAFEVQLDISEDKRDDAPRKAKADAGDKPDSKKSAKLAKDD